MGDTLGGGHTAVKPHLQDKMVLALNTTLVAHVSDAGLPASLH
jgi:hypothetical protein